MRVRVTLLTTGVFLLGAIGMSSCSWISSIRDPNARVLSDEIEQVEEMLKDRRALSVEDMDGAEVLEYARLKRERDILHSIRKRGLFTTAGLKSYKQELKVRASELHAAIPVLQEKLQSLDETRSERRNRRVASLDQVDIEPDLIPESRKAPVSEVEEELHLMLKELGRINHEFQVIDHLLTRYQAA